MAYTTEMTVALEAARAAEAVHRAGRQTELQIGSKSTVRDLVTQVDTESEEVVRAVLSGAFPDDSILGEEAPELHRPSDRRWIVDPLDGTLNYAHGFPFYCVSIALEVRGEVVLGVVLDTARGDLFTTVRGGGAFLDGERLQVSAAPVLEEAMLATGFAYTAERRRVNLELFGRVLPRARCLRRPGSAALDLCNVAAGRIDGFWELWLNPWDVAAGTLAVREAGGHVTDRHGGPFALDDLMVVATNGTIHEELVGLLDSDG